VRAGDQLQDEVQVYWELSILLFKDRNAHSREIKVHTYTYIYEKGMGEEGGYSCYAI
jgi:hypothetical protein